MRRLRLGVLALTGLVVAALALPGLASAGPLPGAIFTTLSDGSEVNLNQFPSKEAVYLDGGPGPGAPIGAAGLPAGTYVFQVTNPNGDVLLSTDLAKCRQLTVDSNGVISGVVAAGGCEHSTSFDLDHGIQGARTVQLIPYDDTPNNGGVYKVWVTPLANYLDGCTQLGEADGLNVVDCGLSSNIHHGFIGDDSKTDNFKVKSTSPEIDTVFKNAATGAPLDGRGVTWFDTNGASNQKWSYYAPALQVNHEAHVEGVEVGTHKIKIANQPGCTVDSVKVDGVVTDGPQTVSVKVKNARKDTTFFIYVYCG